MQLPSVQNVNTLTASDQSAVVLGIKHKKGNEVRPAHSKGGGRDLKEKKRQLGLR